MTIRLPLIPSLVTLALTSLALGGCLTPGIVVDTEGSASETETTTTGETSGTVPTATDTTTTDTTTTMTMQTTSAGVCGDGTVDAGEECDDGAGNGDSAACTSECMNNVCGDGLLLAGVEECDDGNEANDDSCTSSCKDNICGDGFVNEGVEICDDGVNDGSYGGCMDNCAQLGPYCGDTFLQEEFEECDNVDISSGCLSTCKQARSCLEILNANGGAPSGVYPIWTDAEGFETLDVYCDMETDGGGYTFLKVAVDEQGPSAAAEAECAKYGMSLMIPRSPDHLFSTWTVATTENVKTLGDAQSEYDGYASMFGIYPVDPSISCPGSALNNVDCPEWTASDGGPYFVSSIPYEDQPSTNTCLGCSIEYVWTPDGMLLGYQALKYGGWKSRYFMCDVGDKTP